MQQEVVGAGGLLSGRFRGMASEEFCRDVVSPGGYRTAAGVRKSLGDRLFGWSDLWYYIKLFKVVWNSSRIGKRGGYTQEAWLDESFSVVRVVEQCGGTVAIDGFMNAATVDGPVVYVANHMSLLETFLLPCAMLTKDFLCIVLKTSLMEYPVFREVLRAIRPIGVARKNPRDDLKTVMKEGLEAIKQGRSMLVFPQSTRMPGLNVSEFNSLGCKLAERSGVPLVPVALCTNFMRTGRLIKDFGRIDRQQPVRFAYGEPLDAVADSKAAHAASVEFISGKMKEWGLVVG